MAVTPQTNPPLEEIAETLLKSDDICICGHVSPDGDCIGSQLALRAALVQLGKRATVLLASDDPIDAGLRSLPGADQLVPAKDLAAPCAVFVQVDAPDVRRIGEDAAKVRAAASKTITIDHHAVPERQSDLSYTDPDAAATALLIWRLAAHLGVDRDYAIATCAYAGLMTDTGRFQHSNTDAAVFRAACEMVDAGADPAALAAAFFQQRTLASIQLEARCIEHMELLCDGQAALSYITFEDMASLGAVKSDCEQLVDVLRSIKGVRVAAMLRDEGTQVRGSFRAKDTTDVATLARRFGGGGHRAAAGFTLHEPLERALRQVRKVVCAAVSDEALR